MKLRNRWPNRVGTAIAAILILSGCSEGPPATHDEIIRKDLAEILNLQGSRCENVQSFEIDERFDYLVSCDNGVVYRIHVGAEGHVNVNEHPDESTR